MEALLAVDDIKPDILLSDIRMPHMTGIELATIIRKKFPRCKIIFLSGYADKEYLMSAIELKVVNYIEKPIDVVEIRKAVSKAVMQLESEQKEELIHDGFQKALPIIHEEIVSALVSPGLDWQRFSQDFIPLYFEWTKIGNYSLSCIRPVKKLAGDAGARAFLSSVARAGARSCSGRLPIKPSFFERGRTHLQESPLLCYDAHPGRPSGFRIKIPASGDSDRNQLALSLPDGDSRTLCCGITDDRI